MKGPAGRDTAAECHGHRQGGARITGALALALLALLVAAVPAARADNATFGDYFNNTTTSIIPLHEPANSGWRVLNQRK